MLKKLGATHVINYSEDLNWGETARGLTVNNTGVDVVVDVRSPFAFMAI
jgi:NADPH:quinone reductase-like Zn-dependent oxidoreductase